MANHVWFNNHSIDYEGAHGIEKSNVRVLETLESWHMALSVDADDNSKQLLKQYSILL